MQMCRSNASQMRIGGDLHADALYNVCWRGMFGDMGKSNAQEELVLFCNHQLQPFCSFSCG